jgi:REP element-mobilizing transposase RayT
MKQYSFFKQRDFPKEFGGSLLVGKRKSRRPISIKKSLHVVLKADAGATNFFKHRKFIDNTLQKFGDRFQIKIYRKGLESNHLHLILKFSSTESYKNFVRAVSGVLAKALKVKWLYRPYSRIIEWGNAFKKATIYVLQNELEGLGVIPRKPRKKRCPQGLVSLRFLAGC